LLVPAEWLSGDRPESALTSDNSENTTDQVRVCQLHSGGDPPGVLWDAWRRVRTPSCGGPP